MSFKPAYACFIVLFSIILRCMISLFPYSGKHVLNWLRVNFSIWLCCRPVYCIGLQGAVTMTSSCRDLTTLFQRNCSMMCLYADNIFAIIWELWSQHIITFKQHCTIVSALSHWIGTAVLKLSVVVRFRSVADCYNCSPLQSSTICCCFAASAMEGCV